MTNVTAQDFQAATHVPHRPVEVTSVQSSSLLRLRAVSKSFGATKALTDVSISFEAGEIHCLLGENGAGKSTIGKIIGGLYAPDTGDVLLESQEVRINSPSHARALGIAVVHQELSLAPDLSVRDNLWLGAETKWCLSRQGESRRAVDVLSQLGLELDLEKPVSTLPIGTQQLVEIGKALMNAPRLIVFDEPTAMLGAVEKQQLFTVLRRLRASGISVILVTHHIDDVMEVGDCVTVMRNGRCVDSFALEDHLQGADVLERLTGQRQVFEATHELRETVGEILLEIETSGVNGTTKIPVRRGEIVGLYGVLGCGAEDIVQGLVGLRTFRNARYLLGGKSFKPSQPVEAMRRGVGYLAAGRQQNGVLGQRSIRENLMLTQLHQFSVMGWLSRASECKRATQQLADAAVKYGCQEDTIESLSGGNQQKILLARAMAGARDLLVLEEPTAGVDIGAKQQIHERIKAAAAQGLSVVVLSSDLPEVIALCDTIYTLHQGHIVNQYEAPDETCQAQIVGDVLGKYEVQS
ncbi:sugar ABC transporter ATP-binding protein [Pusillimonas caeni]|uniref:sugar ABC transporter ATP-binding protein n=1 Tax=Pusillimonas caeni TaxID=1348472 RepID=UPI000E59946D|nr:sugar ABC transporter ATP-binding protein [Pusillimonas caeni]TFL15374.1 sugar ABC transporter ATP-binding protein [Pusillimonas caeni]